AAAALAAVAGLTILVAGCGGDSPTPTIGIRVGGSRESVNVGTTLGEAADMLGLRPRSGGLIDGDGRVLHARAYPGRRRVNVRGRWSASVLRRRDRIRIVNGRNRRERLVRRVTPVEGGVPPDPQFKLVRRPGVEVVVEGAVSHKLVSQRYRATRGPERV